MKRRTFIQNTAAASVAVSTSFYIPGIAKERRLKIGLIGVGWYGMVDVKAALQVGGVEVVGICDIDTDHLKSGADELEKLQGKRPKEFTDYHDLLEFHGLEAIFIGTPPHWHALQFIAACDKGLPVYCEKPLSYDVREGQAMVKAAEDAGNIVQLGFQRRQSGAFRRAKELIGSGKLGKIHEIEAHIHYNPGIKDTTIQDPPASLDWDAWCGPAPKLPYRPSIGHLAWRLEKAYGNGHLVDWGIHNIDIIRTIMGFGMPQSFTAHGGLNVLTGKITTPDTLHTRMDFEACPVRWNHRLWGSGGIETSYNNGITFYGSKGSLFASDGRVVLMPAGKNAQQIVEQFDSDTMQQAHVAGFLQAVRHNDPALLSCTIQDAFQSTATVQLAMISYYTQSAVSWNFDKKMIVGNASAAALLARPYRAKYLRPTF